ncbi:hypothetical protein, conserved [Plasmodium vivax]|uniref:Uncharacterized protein n=1 Tax=Plasmodium vivax (strain Salvador I) TaxID=126793 RepID=A5KB34_PLAVS|nr:hypothetical protein, conserved [Plasmodium vivax]EDL43312.1 hypothetical protein, conserved [Plasmodium vivax]|eukprot:XP_001613039.1 hypothetical protein [Plasmodium vivax Sal-1]
MEVKPCPKRYFDLDGCTSYFYALYNLYPSEFEIKHIDFLKHIKDFPDPILKYVALYFYYNYSVAKDYFTGESGQNDLACHNLNRWLDQHKSFFTHSEKCEYNKNQWNINIEPLWEKNWTLLHAINHNLKMIFVMILQKKIVLKLKRIVMKLKIYVMNVINFA